jgi:hypothetical protein
MHASVSEIYGQDTGPHLQDGPRIVRGRTKNVTYPDFEFEICV